MISDLDETLRQLLIRQVPLDTAEVEVAFELPDRQWASGLSRPTLNLYLYDIQENHELRAHDWEVERGPNGTATKRRLPIRVDLSYLVTAWTAAVEDEHRLLWRVLAALLRHPVLPSDILQGDLRRLEYPIPAKAAQPDGVLKNASDFWSAIDNHLKPSISYVVTLPLDLEVALTVPLVFTKGVRLHGLEGGYEEIIQIAGRVRRQVDGAPVVEAAVRLKERGPIVQTDAEGRFAFTRVPPGTYTLHIIAGDGSQKEQTIEVPGASYDVEL